MADNVVANSGSGGATFRTDDDGTAHWPYTKLAWGADNTQTIVADTGGSRIPVNVSALGDSSVIGAGTEAGAVRVTVATDSTGILSVDDNGGNLSIDIGGTVPTLNSGAADAGTQRVTIATGDVVSIDDGGNSITVDGTALSNIDTNTTDIPNVIGTDGAAGPSSTLSVGGTESGGNIQELRVDADGHLQVDVLTSDAVSNTISTNNSTTSTLGVSGVFTGTADDVSSYAAVTIQLDSSHDSATDGMTFQFSSDNTNWDDVYTFTYTAAGGARRFQFPITAQYFRVVYTNGGTGQTHFRVQTILHHQPVTGSIHRLVDNVDPDRSSSLTKAVLIAQAGGSGDFLPVQSTGGGNLKMDVEEIAGVTPSLNTGAVDAGTQRVTVATDDVVSTDWNGTAPPIGAGTEAAALRVTVATDSTGTLTVDGSELTTLAGAVSGTEMQVDVVAPLPAGTNAIGKLAANSGVDIGDVDVLSQPALDRLTDNVGVALQTDRILNDTTALTPQFAIIDAATSGNNLLVAAGTNKIRVLALMMVAAGDVTARFESGSDGTALSGQMDLTANSGFTLPFNPVGWFETASATLLNLELDAAVSVDGMLVYVDVA